MAEQSNPGKVAIIVGTVLGLAAAGLGVLTLTGDGVQKVNTAVETPSAKGLSKGSVVDSDGKARSLVAESEAAAAVLDRLNTRKFKVTDVAPPDALINGNPRYTPLFFAPEFWQVADDDGRRNLVIDIYDPSAPPIHGDIPNVWFIENGIAGALGRSDGPELDSDNDGFTNREEHAAKTSPSDPSSMPALVSTGSAPKLEVVSVESNSAQIAFDPIFGEAPATIGVKVYPDRASTKATFKADVSPNSTFGLKEGSSRFTVIGFEKHEFTDASGNPTSPGGEVVVRVRDGETAGLEKEFIVRTGRSRDNASGRKEIGTPQEKGRMITDTFVTIAVTAGSAAGTPEGQVRVPVGGTFTVPGTDNLTCKLESVDENGSANVIPQGAESPVNVPKAK